MAFLRVKRIRDRDYAYLVESRWDPERRSSRQATLRYLGPVDRIRLENIPPEFRSDRIRSFVEKHSGKDGDHQARAVGNARRRFFQALVSGDRERARKVAEEAREELGPEAFCVDVLTPTMQRIGDLWKEGELSVSMEHLASNVSRDLMDLWNSQARGGRRLRGSAVLCTPQGEMHSLGTKVLEGLLLRRGYAPWNIAASAPTDAIVDFIASKRPDLVLISLTIPEYVPSLRRLLERLRARRIRAKVLLGGQGLRVLSPEDVPRWVELVGERVLPALDAACGIRRPSGSGSPRPGSGSPRT